MKKIVFVDRDGVINQNAAPHQYITRVEDFVFNPGIFGLLRDLQNQGFECVVITNQRGVARQHYTEQTLRQIHVHMVTEFEKQGINILDVFYCPHDVGTCECRKPKPGLLVKACEKYPIDLSVSILVSDSAEDVEMGKKFGIAVNYLLTKDEPQSFYGLSSI